MSRKDHCPSGRSSFENKLAAYAIAGGAALALPGAAQATPIYSGLLNQTISNPGSLNLTGPGGDIDFTFTASTSSGGGEDTGAVSLTGLGGNLFAGGLGIAQGFDSGDLMITPNWTSNGVISSMTKEDGGGHALGWSSGSTRYVALQFDTGNYGWAQVNVVVSPTSAQMTLIDWAYESVAGEFITAGAGASAVPEPSSLALLALGAAGLVSLRRRRVRTAA